MGEFIMTRQDLARNLVRHAGARGFKVRVQEGGLVVVSWEVMGRGGWQMWGFTAEVVD